MLGLSISNQAWFLVTFLQVVLRATVSWAYPYSGPFLSHCYPTLSPSRLVFISHTPQCCKANCLLKTYDRVTSSPECVSYCYFIKRKTIQPAVFTQREIGVPPAPLSVFLHDDTSRGIIGKTFPSVPLDFCWDALSQALRLTFQRLVCSCASPVISWVNGCRAHIPKTSMSRSTDLFPDLTHYAISAGLSVCPSIRPCGGGVERTLNVSLGPAYEDMPSVVQLGCSKALSVWLSERASSVVSSL